MWAALPLGQREHRCIVGIASHAGSHVDRQTRVIAVHGSPSAIHFDVFMTKVEPFAGKVALARGWRGDQREYQEECSDDDFSSLDQAHVLPNASRKEAHKQSR